MRYFLLLLFLFALPGSFSEAARADNFQKCNQSEDHDRRIIGCTFVLKLGQLDKTTLATAHLNRGAAYARKGQLDTASADFISAIAFNPDYGAAYFNRGLINRGKTPVSYEGERVQIAQTLRADLTRRQATLTLPIDDCA